MPRILKERLVKINLILRTQLHPTTELKNVYKNTQYPAHSQIKLTMLGIQLKITRQAKKQENMTQDEETKQLTQTDLELTQIVALEEQDFKFFQNYIAYVQ